MVDMVNENVIEFLRNEKRATVTLCQPRYITRIRELAEKYPEECQITHENKDGSILAHIPTAWVKINPPMQLNDEQRERLAERMRNVRDALRENS